MIKTIPEPLNDKFLFGHDEALEGERYYKESDILDAVQWLKGIRGIILSYPEPCDHCNSKTRVVYAVLEDQSWCMDCTIEYCFSDVIPKKEVKKSNSKKVR